MGFLAVFFNAWGVGFSGAVMPGPLLTVNIQESYRRGVWAGPLLVLGHALLETMLVVGIVWGLDRWIRLEITKGVLGLIGGLFLLWMAYGMLRNGGKDGLDLNAQGKPPSRGIHPIAAGVLLSLSNPYWALWWATIGIGLIIKAQQLGGLGVGTFLIGHLLADFVWYTFVSVAIAKGRHIISPHFFRGLIVVCGLFLIYLSVKDFIPLGLKSLGVMNWLRKLV
jgi:threonine/homoserine/homoserine lactone efflux protein